MSGIAGVGGASLVFAVFASVGGFGCLCNVASARCGDVEEPTLREPDQTGDTDGGTGSTDAAKKD